MAVSNCVNASAKSSSRKSLMPLIKAYSNRPRKGRVRHSSFFHFFARSLLLHFFGEFNHAFIVVSGLRLSTTSSTCSNNFGFNILINLQHTCIHNAHIHACFDSMIQKNGMNGFAHYIISTERERKITYTTAYFGIWQVLLDPTGCIDKIDTVVIMLFNACGNASTLGSKIISWGGNPTLSTNKW